MTALAAFQSTIYAAGADGVLPEHPIQMDAWQRRAAEVLDEGPLGYVDGHAGSGRTGVANREALDRWAIVPRMLRGAGLARTATTVLGREWVAPMALAPVGVQSIFHPDGELASARAASALDVLFIASTASAYSLEETAAASGDGPRWFQLYWPNDRELAASFISRAGEAGYEAIVVTLDTPLLAWRPRDLTNAYLPFLKGIGIANYTSDEVFMRGLNPEDSAAIIARWAERFGNPALGWDDIAWLRERTSLPIILKGLQSTDDARAAREAGVEAIVVSNHGGRQVDGAIGSFTTLPRIVDAVADEVEVLFDSGIRSGSDVIKALAFGAGAALIGRPYIWGLAVGGEVGVRQVMQCLLAEFQLTMTLSGLGAVEDIDASLVTQRTG